MIGSVKKLSQNNKAHTEDKKDRSSQNMLDGSHDVSEELLFCSSRIDWII